jgi:hypothetical protein
VREKATSVLGVKRLLGCVQQPASSSSCFIVPSSTHAFSQQSTASLIEHLDR